MECKHKVMNKEMVTTYNIESVLESLDEEEGLGPVSTAVVDQTEDKHAQQELVDEPLKAYLKEIGASELLTFEEEKALARAIEYGAEAKAKLEGGASDVEGRLSLQQAVKVGESARRRMTESNLRLVVSIAKKYQGKGLPLLDLIQEGNLGLLRAVDKYDYRRGFRFSTYATWWIRQGVMRALTDKGHTIRLPVHLSETASKVEKATQALTQELGRRPQGEEISEATGIDQAKIKRIMRAWQQPASLDQPQGKRGSAPREHADRQRRSHPGRDPVADHAERAPGHDVERAEPSGEGSAGDEVRPQGRHGAHAERHRGGAGGNPGAGAADPECGRGEAEQGVDEGNAGGLPLAVHPTRTSQS